MFTDDFARREGLSGFVRNLPDGRVEAVVEGDVESVGRVETALWRGPSRARVDDIDRGTTTSGRLTASRGDLTDTLCIRRRPDDAGEMEILKAKIRHVPDFPKPGILFYDITTLLGDADGFRLAVDALVRPYRRDDVDLVVGVESRGFILAAAVADRLRRRFRADAQAGEVAVDDDSRVL